MTKYLYKNYIKTLSERFEGALTTILAGYNFDYGDEFEIVLCEILRLALPDKYGICRGHIVDAAGNQVGDDIIIYEQSRFPTFGLRNKDNFSRKEFIPVEAVYCYIEAKNTINLTTDIADNQSLIHAMEQTCIVKRFCSARRKITQADILPHFKLEVGPGLSMTWPQNPSLPENKNPLYTVVFARQVRDGRNGEILTDANSIHRKLLHDFQALSANEYFPDLITLGNSNIVIPGVNIVPNAPIERHTFWLNGKSKYISFSLKNSVAFGIALASIMSALDWINLGTLPWDEIIADGVNQSLFNKHEND